MSWLDRVRAKASDQLDRLPGKLGELASKANEALGRPLASADELADRRAFVIKTTKAPTMAASTKAPVAPPAAGETAPVIVYHMDKTRRDATKLTEILDANNVPYKVMNIQEDPAAQYAVRRDSNGLRLPVVFVAGECIGGREHLVNAASSGELKKKVFGA